MGLLALAALALGISGFSQNERIVSLDFEGPFTRLQASGAKGNVTGDICPPLSENSSGWAAVDMRYSRLAEGAFSGKASQRVELLALRDGRAQAWLPIKVSSSRYSRLRFAARAPRSGSITVAIRLQGAPYTEPWTNTVVLSPEWRQYDMLIAPVTQATNEGYVLMLYFSAPVTDLDDVDMEFVDVDRMVANAPVQKGNLCPNSSFIVGLPSPWSISSGPIGAKVGTDSNTVGPTGFPALKMEPGYTANVMPMVDEVAVVSPPLRLNQCRTHTVSLFVKGTQPNQTIELQLGQQGGLSQIRQLQVGNEWKRYEANFKLPYIVEGYANLTIKAFHPVWIDGVQVEESDKASAFLRASATELQVRASRPFGLSVGNQPLSLTCAILGSVPKSAKLVGNLIDSYEKKYPIGPFAIPANARKPFEIALPELPNARYGTFIAEVRLANRTGKPLSAWAEAVVHRVRPARYADRDAPGSPFGIHIDPIDSYAGMVKQLGFNWIRIHDAAALLTKWYFLEKEPGVFDFSRADAGIKLFRGHKLMILGMLDTSPPWKSRSTAASWFQKYNIPRPDSMDAWSDYCRKVVDRYKKDIRYWEVWNEPYVPDFFRVSEEAWNKYVPGTPKDYVPLLKSAYSSAKQADPTCEVIWANQPGDWAKGCTGLKAQDFSDLASLHWYAQFVPTSFIGFGQTASAMNALLPAGTKRKAYWNTEGGIGGTNDTHILRHTAKTGSSSAALEQADFLVRYQLASLVGGVKRFFLYTWHYHGWNASWDLLLPDGMLAPNATALSSFMWHIEGKAYRSTAQLNDRYDAYLFEGTDADVVVIAAKIGTGADLRVPKLPNGTVLRDLFGNDRPTPAKIDLRVWYVVAPKSKGLQAMKSLIER